MVAVGNFLFRWRNVIFPAGMVALVLLFRPPEEATPGLTASGLALVLLGQALRVLTIGLDYIKRGGVGGKFFAHGLVTGGIYSHCRNPIYFGNLLIVAGYFFIVGNPWGWGVAMSVYYLAYRSIVAGEEEYLRGRFGKDFAAYCDAVPRWLPRAAGLATTVFSAPFRWKRVIAKEYGTLFTTWTTSLALLAWRHARLAGWGDVARHGWLYGGLAAAGAVFYIVARVLKKTDRLRAAGAS